MNPSIKDKVYSIDFDIGVAQRTKLVGDIFQFSYIYIYIYIILKKSIKKNILESNRIMKLRN